MRISLYEFMTGLVQPLGGEPDEAAADLLMSAMVSDYAELMSFLSSGADPAVLLGAAQGIPRCSVADSHCPEAYLTALELFTAAARR